MQDNSPFATCPRFDNVRGGDSSTICLPIARYATKFWGLTRTHTSAPLRGRAIAGIRENSIHSGSPRTGAQCAQADR